MTRVHYITRMTFYDRHKFQTGCESCLALIIKVDGCWHFLVSLLRVDMESTPSNGARNALLEFPSTVARIGGS
jgi:hypothetical protein